MDLIIKLRRHVFSVVLIGKQKHSCIPRSCTTRTRNALYCTYAVHNYSVPCYQTSRYFNLTVGPASCFSVSARRCLKTLHLRLNCSHSAQYFSTSCCKLKNKKGSFYPSKVSESEEDDGEEGDDAIEDTEVEELFQQGMPLEVSEGGHQVFIVHPDVKWGAKKQHLTTEKIRSLPQITAVFMNVERVSPLTEKELKEAWGVKVFDRYTVVLHIFRCNARTKEAKLQIALAEIPLLRSQLRNELANLDQQGGGSRYIMGSGETFMEVQQRLLKERELKIRAALEKLKKKRHLLRSQRKQREFPVISVMGYTNCGKTTLIKSLTGDAGLQPRDQLFATLDVTVHAGLLPSHMPVLFVDTIGFLSQLPHQLIDSFSATLEDVAHSDLIIHVRDISHPETLNQKVNVLNVLKKLQLPTHLLDSVIEVHNKIDLIDGYQTTEPNTVAISALQGKGLQNLRSIIEAVVLKITGKQIMTIKVNLTGSQLSWLYKEATVQEVNVLPEEGSANVNVIISNSAYGRYRKLFHV
ncbi:GTP-binding protein, chloroplastic [Acipenser ruthenus]|uniref:GTP-binding protein, chloroplastic n=1 Tax=Acipenser ruthenus TaxID=7906 RepID=A0A444UJL1_ACIRT|nr:GTP-binding protein, chloroplastic [Acipenser ruthenus]